MKIALVIPSLGATHLERCLGAVAALDPAPDMSLVVMSGDADLPSGTANIEILRHRERLGFAAAVNTGLRNLPTDVDAAAILNDDALPCPEWLRKLAEALAGDSSLAAVQGTSTDDTGTLIDGRGIEFDRCGLPVQIGHGTKLSDDSGTATVTAVSGTASLYRMDALRETALQDFGVFDEKFDSYHEDLDLGLRLTRMGWRSAWIGEARVRHLGSATGPSFRWHHTWWVLANRWRALSGNLSRHTLFSNTPRLYRGEIRATRALLRKNWRALPVAFGVTLTLPLLIAYGWQRPTPGPRLTSLPGVVG